VIAWFRRWRARAAEARRQRAALAPIEQRAVSAFSAAYPERRAPAARAHPCASGHVAIVMWVADVIPMPRTFWLVDADGVREIDHDRAATLIRVPVWR
jgi:hypothetical protein